MNLGPGLTIKQSIGVATTSSGFQGVDGILGVGPVDLTQGTVQHKTTVPTVTDNLFKAGKIAAHTLGIFYRPINSGSAGKGEMTWGGVDSTKIVGSLNYVPITTVQPASFYWGVKQTVTYNGQTILPLSAGAFVIE